MDRIPFEEHVLINNIVEEHRKKQMPTKKSKPTPTVSSAVHWLKLFSPELCEFNVKGDGNCQYYVVSLLVFGTVEKWRDVRHAVARQMRDNANFSEAYFESHSRKRIVDANGEFSSITIFANNEEYCDKIDNTNLIGWGTFHTLRAAAIAYKVAFNVLIQGAHEKNLVALVDGRPDGSNGFFLFFFFLLLLNLLQ